jgi:hypothetical protein
MLSLEITKNIINNGTWENSFTKFSGTLQQTISQQPAKIFKTDFSDLDSLSSISGISDIIVDGNFNLSRSTLNMNNNEINISGSLYNGTIKSAKIKNATLSNLNGYDNIEIRGIVKIDDGNNFYGNLLVTDTLQSIPYGGGAHTYILYNYGNLENFGLIRDEPSQGENFALYVKGDIINKGRFTNYRTYLLFFSDHISNVVKCFNIGTANCLFNGSAITGNGASSFAITSGGNVQTVPPNQSYDLTLQFNPSSVDTTAVLNINCSDIGTFNNIYLVGHKHNSPTDINEDELIPDEYLLYQNYPNPFNPITTIRYMIPQDASRERQKVTLKVYDILGNEIATLVNEEKSPGTYEVYFNPASGIRHMASGIYFYRMKAGDFIETKKMILMK